MRDSSRVWFLAVLALALGLGLFLLLILLVFLVLALGFTLFFSSYLFCLYPFYPFSLFCQEFAFS
jgi:hypothetical protein